VKDEAVKEPTRSCEEELEHKLCLIAIERRRKKKTGTSILRKKQQQQTTIEEELTSHLPD
jgi:hypothetical protein